MNRFLFLPAFALLLSFIANAQDPEIGSEPGSRTSGDSVRPRNTDREEFVEPTLDYDDMLRRVHYPEKARVNGIEGIVIVRVLISKEGTPVDFRIDRADSDLLVDAAVDAAMATKFTPALERGQPVQVWVSIPINFALAD
jgi:TonB family protein